MKDSNKISIVRIKATIKKNIFHFKGLMENRTQHRQTPIKSIASLAIKDLLSKNQIAPPSKRLNTSHPATRGNP